MKTFLNKISILFVFTLVISGCEGENVNKPKKIESDYDKVYITDRTAKKWEISHAVNKYGMDPANFRYGLGPYAIRPINSPEMISPDQSGYPADNSTEVVLGVTINNDARAYSIRVLSSREVVNDRVGGVDVAVVY